MGLMDLIQRVPKPLQIQMKIIKWMYDGESGGLIRVKLAKIVYNSTHQSLHFMSSLLLSYFVVTSLFSPLLSG